MSSVAVRVTLGIALAFAGVLGLIDLVVDGADLGLWWIGVQLGASAVFWVAFATDRGSWWAAIPGAVLAAIGVRSLLELSASIPQWREFVFFAIASLGFWAVAATKKRRWWAIIPAGMLVSLGAADVTERLVEGTAHGNERCTQLLHEGEDRIRVFGPGTPNVTHARRLSVRSCRGSTRTPSRPSRSGR